MLSTVLRLLAWRILLSSIEQFGLYLQQIKDLRTFNRNMLDYWFRSFNKLLNYSLATREKVWKLNFVREDCYFCPLTQSNNIFFSLKLCEPHVYSPRDFSDSFLVNPIVKTFCACKILSIEDFLYMYCYTTARMFNKKVYRHWNFWMSLACRTWKNEKSS